MSTQTRFKFESESSFSLQSPLGCKLHDSVFETRNASVEDKHEAIDCTIRVFIPFLSCTAVVAVAVVQIIIYIVDTAKTKTTTTKGTHFACNEAKSKAMKSQKIFIKLIKWRRNKNNANAINAISIGTFSFAEHFVWRNVDTDWTTCKKRSERWLMKLRFN